MVRPDSLRRKVYDEWVNNPYVLPKKMCENLGLNYVDHGNYVHKLLSEFRSYYSFGLPQKAHLFPEHRVFEWENVPRGLLPGEGDLERRLTSWGWRRVVNRNDVWSFRDSFGQGSVHWYVGGLVRLYLKGELQLAKAKELFCRAFRWFDGNDLRKYLDVPLVEKYRKWTFEMGQPVPRFDIRMFEASHGLRIFSDGCYTPDTFVLAENSIKLYNEMKVGDLVWSLDIETNAMELQPIEKIMEYDYTGDLIHFKTHTIDLKVTENHGMLLRTLKLEKLFYEPAVTAKNRTTARLPILGQWVGEAKNIPIRRGVSSKNCKLLEKEIGEGDVLELCGWYVGDGCVGKTAKGRATTTEVTVYEPIDGKFRQNLETLLHRLSISFDDRQDSVRFRCEELARFFSDNFGCGAENKAIPEWLQLLQNNMIQRFWNGLMKADGQFWDGLPKAFYTISKKLAEQFMILTMKLGLSPKIRELNEKVSYIKGRRVSCSKSYIITFRRSQYAFTHTSSQTSPTGYRAVPISEHYDGKVWCFEVKKNHNFAVGRNGRFVFCGNSHPTCWHVGESIPFWLDEQREATKELGVVVREFGYDVKEHLKLITGAQEFVKEVYEEAKEWRAERKLARLKPLKRMIKKKPSQKSLFEWMHVLG